MGFSRDNHLTEAGSAYVLGYMTNRAPEIAEEAMTALRALDEEEPGIWLNKPA